VLYGRDFGDGGWFGVHGLNPQGAGSTLTAANLIAPTLQYTTNGGLSWVTDTNVSNDYVTALTGAYAGGGAPTNAATFNLSLPLTGVDGIRLIGSMGGPTGDGFLGADEIEVLAGPVPEPSTWVLLFGGVAILAVVIRRRAVRA
jgi:hypothetical protein